MYACQSVYPRTRLKETQREISGGRGNFSKDGVFRKTYDLTMPIRVLAAKLKKIIAAHLLPFGFLPVCRYVGCSVHDLTIRLTGHEFESLTPSKSWVFVTLDLITRPCRRRQGSVCFFSFVFVVYFIWFADSTVLKGNKGLQKNFLK